MIEYSGAFENSPIGFAAESNGALVQQREDVYDKFFGDCETVLHEMIPFVPHVDVYRFSPNASRDFYTYVTGGMSDLPMASPPEAGPGFRRTELVFYAAEANDEYGELLRWLAHFPHDNKTWLHWGHTLPNGNPPEPFFNSGSLDTLVFMPSVVQPDSELAKHLVWKGEPINLLWCVPITAAECELKLEKGMHALYDLFEANQHPFVFHGSRASYV